MATISVIELVADSSESWDDAVRQAVAEAAKTVRHITGVEVCNMTGTVENGRVARFRADVHVAFEVEPNRKAAGATAV